MLDRGDQSSLPLSTSIGDGFINFIRSHNHESSDLDGVIDFVSSRLFLSSFGSNSLVDLLISQLISDYRNRASTTNRLLAALLHPPISPALTRCASLLPALPGSFFDEVPNDFRIPLAKIFSRAISQQVASLANSYLERQHLAESQSQLELLPSIVSLSDVLNENVADFLENAPKPVQ
jgi:hypothetical protein